jgi:murein DD-endopeptidase MepM/ murein hydrolase activator NlpD
LTQQLFELAQKIDSLGLEVESKDRFIANFQRVLSGDTASFNDPAQTLRGEDQPLTKPVTLKATSTDSAFRKDFEKSDLSLISLTNSKYSELEETFFYSPITGFVSDQYDVRKGHLGVDVVAKANEPIKCIADGTVVFSAWTQDAGYVIVVQHRGNLISTYKHNAQLLKKVGTFVNGGEIVAIVGNSGELTNGPHLHFELWYNGNSVNPEEFVTF